MRLRERRVLPCTGITKMTDNGRIMKVVSTKRVILALPAAAALQRIEVITPTFTGRLKRIINDIASECTAVPLMKILAAWAERWWNTVSNLDTFSPTDMPTCCGSRSTDFTRGRFTNDLTSQVFAWYPSTLSRPRTAKDNAAACNDMSSIQLYVAPDRLPKFVPAVQIEDQYDCQR